jgi:hypothetical protein
VLVGIVVVIFRSIRRRIERKEIEMDPLLHPELDLDAKLAETTHGLPEPHAAHTSNGAQPREVEEDRRQAPPREHTNVGPRL